MADSDHNDSQEPKRTTVRRKRVPYSPRLTISIDQETIEASTRRKSSHCMIAEAIKRAIPRATGVSVDLQAIRWTDPDLQLRYVFLTPREAQIALLHFDRGETPESFTMKLSNAHVTRANPTVKSTSHRERWEPIREALNTYREETGLTIAALEAEIGDIHLNEAMGVNGRAPSAAAETKVRDWIVNEVPTLMPAITAADAIEPQAPKSRRHRVPVKAEIRTQQNGSMRIIGGRPAATGNVARRRVFGMRQYIE
jgi:hypothetical protein